MRREVPGARMRGPTLNRQRNLAQDVDEVVRGACPPRGFEAGAGLDRLQPRDQAPLSKLLVPGHLRRGQGRMTKRLPENFVHVQRAVGVPGFAPTPLPRRG